LHGDRHPHTRLGVIFDAFRFRIAKKHEHGIADELVDGRFMFKGDHGHLREILVQEARKILRLEILGNLGEILDITEEDGELFTLGFERHILTTGKNGLIDLWREILGELRRKGFEHGVLFVDQSFLFVQFAEEVPMQKEAVPR